MLTINTLIYIYTGFNEHNNQDNKRNNNNNKNYKFNIKI